MASEASSANGLVGEAVRAVAACRERGPVAPRHELGSIHCTRSHEGGVAPAKGNVTGEDHMGFSSGVTRGNTTASHWGVRDTARARAETFHDLKHL
jgi:hypothetical protein